MCKCQFTVCRGRSLGHLHGGHLGDDAVTQQLVFGHGKPVTLRQRQDEVIGVEGLQNEENLEKTASEMMRKNQSV